MMAEPIEPEFWKEQGIYSLEHINRSRMFKDRYPGEYPDEQAKARKPIQGVGSFSNAGDQG